MSLFSVLVGTELDFLISFIRFGLRQWISLSFAYPLFVLLSRFCKTSFSWNQD